jgi:L-iditol 2-dehydrogenase
MTLRPRRVIPPGSSRWNWKAIDVVNAHVRRRADLMESMRIGLELTAKGLIDLGALVTHRYPLDEVDRAYADLQEKPPGFIKGSGSAVG